MSGRRRQNYTGVLFLLLELYNIGSGYIPPGTLCLITIQIFNFLNPLNLSLSIDNACSSVDKVFFKKQYKRIFTSIITHEDDWHLYYNMISFVWKGIEMENSMGSIKFSAVITILVIFSGTISLILQYLLFLITANINYLYQCSIGFSGIIFGLKIISSMRYENSKFSLMCVFLEVVMISFILPNASFCGHIAGIITGLLYSYHCFKYVEDILIYMYSNIKQFYSSLLPTEDE